MNLKYTSLFLAALMLAGSMAVAGEGAFPPGPPPPGQGPRHARFRNPDFRDGRRDGPRDDRRDDRRDRRGPKGRGCEMGEPGMGMMGMGPGMGIGFGDAIDLTADQKAKLVDTMTANFRNGLVARMSHADAAKALKKLKADENADPQAIIDASAALGKAQGEMQVARRKFRSDIQNILTDEQKQKLKEARDDFAKRIRDRFTDRDGPDGDRKMMRRPPMPPMPPRERR